MAAATGHEMHVSASTTTIPNRSELHTAPAHSAVPADLAILLSLTIGCLLPFLAKPLNIDDPLFVWAGKHIQRYPSDFYGFDVNWYGFDYPMALTMKNPPLACYYLAAVGMVGGFGERFLHAAMLLPSFGLASGVYFLARRLCRLPLLAAAAAFLTPAALVSATSLMCDTLMLALWCWAAICWIEGLERRRFALLLASATLTSLAALTKYFGAALVPLLAAYAIWHDVERRRLGPWPAILLIPIGALVAFDQYTARLYGRPLLQDATVYAHYEQMLFATGSRQVLLAAVFLGGCFVTGLIYTPLLWSWPWLAAAGVAGGIVALATYGRESILGCPLCAGDGSRLLVPLHVAVFLLAALNTLALLLTDFWTRRDKAAFLLLMWGLGTLGFASFVNWTINARSLLPLAPVLGIALARRIEQRGAAWLRPAPMRIGWFTAAALLISWAVAWGDYRLAQSAKTAAKVLTENYGVVWGPLWFEGHWGFQYYMQEYGARPVDVRASRLAARSQVAIPNNNTNIYLLPSGWKRVARLPFRASNWVVTRCPTRGTNFYAAREGAVLPFAFVPAPHEFYDVYELTVNVDFDKNCGIDDPGKVLDR